MREAKYIKYGLAQQQIDQIFIEHEMRLNNRGELIIKLAETEEKDGEILASYSDPSSWEVSKYVHSLWQQGKDEVFEALEKRLKPQCRVELARRLREGDSLSPLAATKEAIYRHDMPDTVKRNQIMYRIFFWETPYTGEPVDIYERRIREWVQLGIRKGYLPFMLLVEHAIKEGNLAYSEHFTGNWLSRTVLELLKDKTTTIKAGLRERKDLLMQYWLYTIVAPIEDKEANEVKPLAALYPALPYAQGNDFLSVTKQYFTILKTNVIDGWDKTPQCLNPFLGMETIPFCEPLVKESHDNAKSNFCARLWIALCSRANVSPRRDSEPPMIVAEPYAPPAQLRAESPTYVPSSPKPYLASATTHVEQLKAKEKGPASQAVNSSRK